jgi:hypothetical protein
MKKFLILILFVLTATIVFAQSNYQDVVYLKNGSIIHGVIIEQVPNKSIKIETADGNIFVYQIDEIEKLTKEPTKNDGENTGLEQGYKGIVEVGYQIGIGDYGMDRLKLNIINGYQINPYFSLGIGTGLRYYFSSEVPLIPLFADFRANFINGKISPYLSLGIGYSFNAKNSFEGVGFLLNPTLGVSFKISNNSAMNVGLGYEMQKMRVAFIGYGLYYFFYESTENTGAISIDAGISF